MRLENFLEIFMSLKKLINKTIPYIEPYDKCAKALEIMNSFKISELPVVTKADMHYIGLVSETDLLNCNKNMPVVEIGILKNIFVDFSKHIFDVLEMVSTLKISVLPVTDSNGTYLGAVTYKTIIETMAEETSAYSQGGIIEIETDTKNFSPALIAGVSENNSMKVMSLLTHRKGKEKMKATIKFNSQDISGVVQGLEKRGYNVREIHHSDTKYNDLLQERYNALISFLNV